MARAHPGVGFDAASALARFQEALRGGGSIPPWAATGARLSSGVGLTAPAVLSALVALHAVRTGISRWDGHNAAAPRPTPAALYASIAPELPGEPAAVVGPPTTTARMVKAEAARPADDAAEARPHATPELQPEAHRTQTDPVVPLPPRSRPTADAPATHDSPTAADPPAVADPLPPDAMREIQEVASAQRLLASDPAQALSLVRSGEARYSSGYLREERRYVGVVALFKLGRLDEARAEAARFVSDYPDGPFTARVRAAAR